MKTLKEIAALARANFAAHDAHLAHYRTEPKHFDYENEEHIRWKIESSRLCSAAVKTMMAYRDACDEFFKEFAEAASIAEALKAAVSAEANSGMVITISDMIPVLNHARDVGGREP